MSERERKTEGMYRTVPIVAVAEKQDKAWQGLYQLGNGMPDRVGGGPQDTPEAAVTEAMVAAVEMVRLIFEDPAADDRLALDDPDIADLVNARMA